MQLNQVTLPAHSVVDSIAFYRRLGLTLIVEDAHYARFEVPDGQATLSLHVSDKQPSPDGPHVYFECADLDARVARLKSLGVVFESDPVMQTWLWREAWLRDPAGNRICLYWAGENRLYPPWRVAPSDR